MEPLQESRQPQRLYAPSRSALRPPGTPAGTAGGSGGKPDQPWTWDHRWRPAGQDADYAMGGSIPWRGRLILLAVLACCNLALLLHRHLFENLVILLDFVAAVVLFDLLLKLWQASRRTRMRWTTFPAFLGGRLEGILVARPVLEPIGTVRAILRCVRDQRTVHVTGTGEETSFEPIVLYQQIAELNVAEDRIKQLPVAFTLPADVPGTDLGQEEATYWQVALRIPVVGPDFEAVFLAPVYAPSPALKQPTPEGPSRTATA